MMTAREQAVYRRPAFDPAGVIRARREIQIGGVTYPPRAVIPDDRLAAAEVTPALLERWWDQLAIDTEPRPTPADGGARKSRRGG